VRRDRCAAHAFIYRSDSSDSKVTPRRRLQGVIILLCDDVCVRVYNDNVTFYKYTDYGTAWRQKASSRIADGRSRSRRRQQIASLCAAFFILWLIFLSFDQRARVSKYGIVRSLFRSLSLRRRRPVVLFYIATPLEILYYNIYYTPVRHRYTQ